MCRHWIVPILCAATCACGGGEPAEPEASPAPDAEVEPGIAEAYHYRAQAHARAGRWQEAIEDHKNGIRLGSREEWAYFQLGRLMVSHAPEDAVAYFSQAAGGEPPRPQTSRFFWGAALARLGRPEEAVERYREAIRADPAHEMSFNAWGEVLEGQGRLELALEKYGEAVEIHPEYVQAHLNRARVLDALGRPDEAGRHRELADQSNPDTHRVHLYWGRALLKAGRYETAARELEKAIAVDPADEEARRLLATAREHLDGGES